MPRQTPPFWKYLALNLGVCGYLTFQGWILTMALGTSRTIILLSALLAITFFIASMFDYLWLRFGRPED